MIYKAVFVSISAAIGLSGQVSADPTIDIATQERAIEIDVSAQNGPDNPFSGETFIDRRVGPEDGPWTDDLFMTVSGDTGATATALSFQKSNVTTFTIEGEGFVEASASNGTEAVADGISGSGMLYTFTVPEDATFSLTGTIDGETNGPNGLASVSINMFGTKSDGTAFFVQEQLNSSLPFPPLELNEFFHSEEVLAGSTIQFLVSASTGATDGGECRAEYDFLLTFGDTDGDGLLDEWEENGIDIDLDGTPEIMLPNANVEQKNVYVELDASTWTSVDEAAIQDVIFAFSQAPGELVENPNGADGVILHVDRSEKGLPGGTISDWSQFDALKDAWQGSGTDRMANNRDDIMRARDKAYRYCLWTNRVELPNEGGALEKTTGVAERPGNDFIIAADYTRGNTTDPGYDPLLAQDRLAGTFMHELGHTLGLQHGGDSGLNYKPNYTSVMNYAYQIPYPGTEKAFVLDYSGRVMNPLDEGELIEFLGVDGAPTKYILFNPEADGNTPKRAIKRANADQVDWDADGSTSTEPVERDISRMRPSLDPSPGQFLTGHNDWANLWYHLSGDVNFEDGVRLDNTLPTELLDSEIAEFASTQVIDLDAPNCTGDLTTTGATIPGFEGYGEPDGVADLDDLGYYLNFWLVSDQIADLTTTGAAIPGFAGFGEPDGVVDLDDLGYFLNAWLAGCG